MPNSRSSHNVIKAGRPDSHSVVYSSYDRFPGSEDSGWGEFWDRGPQWSPDESKVLFERHGRNNEGERIVDLWTVDVAWSPDGKTLAYLTFDWNKPKEYHHTVHFLPQ